MKKSLKELFGDNHGLDPKSIDFLTGVLEKNNLPGFDYLEFKQSVEALSRMDIELGMAIKSAYVTGATVGLTKEKLIETARHYSKVLLQEKTQFEQAVEAQVQQKVGNKLKEVDKLKKQIIEHKKKIQQLEEQVISFQRTVDTADEQINEETEKIKKAQSNFDYTHRSILNQIEIDIQNFETYL